MCACYSICILHYTNLMYSPTLPHSRYRRSVHDNQCITFYTHPECICMYICVCVYVWCTCFTVHLLNCALNSGQGELYIPYDKGGCTSTVNHVSSFSLGVPPSTVDHVRKPLAPFCAVTLFGLPGCMRPNTSSLCLFRFCRFGLCSSHFLLP